MPIEHADLDPLRADISLALEASTRAETSADEALRISKSNSNQLMGLAVSQERTEAFARRTEETLLDHKRKSEERHVEVLKAIAGAVSTEAKQAADIAEARKSLADAQAAHAADMTAIKTVVDEGKKDLAAVKGDISTAALVKISGAFALVLTALAGLFQALTPPKAPVETHAPSVVYVAAPPSAAPAVSQ